MKQKIYSFFLIVCLTLLFPIGIQGQTEGMCNIPFSRLDEVCQESGEIFNIINKASDAEINVWLKFMDGDVFQAFRKLSASDKIKFIDDFAEISNEGLRILNKKPHLVDYWLKNADFFKKNSYHGADHANWDNAVRNLRNEYPDLVKGFDDHPNDFQKWFNGDDKLNPRADFDGAIKAVGSIDGYPPINSYNRKNFNGKNLADMNNGAYESFINTLEPFIKQHVEYMDLIQQDIRAGGKLYNKLYSGKNIDKIKGIDRAGIHAEVLVLNELIKGKNVQSIEDIKSLNIKIIVRNAKNNQHMCTCPHCFYLTLGVDFVRIK